MSELKRQVVELMYKLDEQKEKKNALELELNEVKQQLVNLTSQYDELEKKSFSIDRFRNCKSLGFNTGFASDEIFDALYNFCDPGENGEIFSIGTHRAQARIQLFLVKIMNTWKHFQSLEDQGRCIQRRNFFLLFID